MSTSPRLGIPFISGQQSQPEVTHNTAVVILQTLLAGVISTLSAPPSSPADGDAYIIGTGASGAWGGRDNKIAVWYGGWNYVPGVDSDGSEIAMGADQAGLSVYDVREGAQKVWSGSVWAAAAGGGAGTPPTIVQHGAENAGAQGITLGAAPTNGNLLVAMCFNGTVDSAGSGWAKYADNGSGSDYGTIYTKTAGASESATQDPLSSAPGNGCIAMWEIHGVVTIVASSTQNEQTGLSGSSSALPLPVNMLFLGALSLLSSSNNITGAYNVVVDDLLDTGASHQIASGHATKADAPFGQIFAAFSGSGSPGNKGSGILLST